ncbi:MAG TPA: CehA/McbA family metallohydrolase [Solirubrobacteraceae bacterium]|nr:CehA/McbA family metallohydrolase [Solirubrobacteraceae bacterium]
MSEALAIAQVTPYPWESGHEVNAYVEAVAADLAARGHRVVVVAPSGTGDGVRDARRAVRLGGDHLFAAPGGGPRVLPVGESLPPLPGRARARAMPIDVARTIEALFAHDVLDVCHVHDPFAPSVASVALRHSRALNVGGFHAPTERIVAAQVARRLVRLVFGRMDARVADYQATAELMERSFPGSYEVVAPAATPPDAGVAAAREADGRVRIAYVEEEERAALRLFLRALRRLEDDPSWEAVVVSARGPSSSTPLRARVRERVRFVAPGDVDVDTVLAAADVLVAASEGAAPAPGLVRRAAAAGAVPVAARLGVYEDALQDGAAGLLFEPDDEVTLAAQLQRVVGDAGLRERLRGAAPRRAWADVAGDLERVYRRLVGRRHDDRGRPDLRARLRGRQVIDVDLHMHTDHSSDCATPVEVLLATARAQGLGAIAVTDHNEISGALEAQAKAAEFGVKVIVGEEVKTASQGEVIGLFLSERIPRGLTLAETVAEIKRQGGIVYVPHPFDRMHAVPDYEHLLDVVDDVDAMEVYNPRVAIGSFNEEAARFAAKYRIPAGAGSDSHVAQGLGSVRIRMPEFEGPEEFLEALRMADIVTKPSSLLYVQALKFLETKATPPGARRARRERRVKRATRKG